MNSVVYDFDELFDDTNNEPDIFVDDSDDVYVDVMNENFLFMSLI